MIVEEIEPVLLYSSLTDATSALIRDEMDT